jgi:hypothetical protein
MAPDYDPARDCYICGQACNPNDFDSWKRHWQSAHAPKPPLPLEGTNALRLIREGTNPGMSAYLGFAGPTQAVALLGQVLTMFLEDQPVGNLLPLIDQAVQQLQFSRQILTAWTVTEPDS